jgi:hypothetical protein
LIGAADAPDVAASPMPAAAILRIKIVRIVISPSITTTPNPCTFLESSSALDDIFIGRFCPH